MQSYCKHSKKNKKKGVGKTEDKKSPSEVIYHIAWAGVSENWYREMSQNFS